MMVSSFSLSEDYWTTFQVTDEDVEVIYNTLLEKEMPMTTRELTEVLVGARIEREKQELERQRSSKGEVYYPKEAYAAGQDLVFPAFQWRHGKVTGTRPGRNPELGDFQVIQVKFDEGETKEFASHLEDHILNNPMESANLDESLDFQAVMDQYGDILMDNVEEALEDHPDFVRIAGRWFPRTLLVDINVGHLNLAEAVLDMNGGGPLTTADLISQIGLESETNQKLVDFSLDLALQEDPRFDEVGPAGEVLWYLHRLEPEEVQQVPVFLRYNEIEYDRGLLTPDMLDLERELDDELSPIRTVEKSPEVEIRLIFPHWRVGTLPLSARIRHLFPTAYEAPRIRFILVDGVTGEKFPGWVVRQKRYVFGLREWYESKGLMPGSIITVRQGEQPGEVIVEADTHRSSREWIRTLLVGSDGGIVFAMLKQVVAGPFDERMAVAVPDMAAVDDVWSRVQKEHIPFERTVVNTVRELAKLNPQSHVHASELYAAVNIMRRCPPGPILALLASRPWFVHVGDLHFRFDDSERG